jgi:large subunit ribosomal protein L25
LNISALDFGKSIKVESVSVENCEILDTPQASIAVVEIPRALRGKSTDDEEEDIEGEEGAEGEGSEATAEGEGSES